MTPPGKRAHSGRAGRRRGPGHPEERSGRPGRERGDTRQVRGGRDQGGESRSTPGGPARYAAYQAVAAVHRDDAYANLALPAILARAGLSGRDAALATELTYGTLRRQGTLDEIIAAVADRPVSRIDPPVRDALRLGVYQLLYTRVPAHAAVSATVGLVKTVAPGATGFANAVLRKVSAESLDAWLARLAPAYQTDPIGNLALTYSHPPWVVRAFSDSLGGDLAEVARLLAENNEPAPVHLCARPGRAEATALADEVGGAPGAFSPYAVYLPGGHPGDLPAVVSGRAHVQDEGSQLVTVALTEVPVSEGPAERWLDLCAGPGRAGGTGGGRATGHGAAGGRAHHRPE